MSPSRIRCPLGADAAGSVLEAIRREGFALIESTPAALSSDAIRQRSTELLALAGGLGTAVVQSPRRELIEDVKDYSDVETSDDRGYRSGGEMLPHSDPPSLIMLHCLREAKEGGETSLVRVGDIVEHMTASRPELVESLMQPFPDWRVAGQHGLADEGPGTPRPVLARHNGVLSCVLYRPYIEKGAAATQVTLTAMQVEALDVFERLSLSPDLTIRFLLQPGETVVLHNRSVLHARTDFVDWPEMSRRRHLVRVWIDAPLTLPVHPAHELGDFFASR